jgi:NAD(P)-dependent dehydrogenase (short-subunit alcohol dehydrogenase family)
MNQGKLKKVVLVTGAAKRLGREIALALASDGWQVAVHYRASEQEAQQTVLDCETRSTISAKFECDLNSENEVRQLVPNVVKHFGQLDAVVNSASTFELDAASDFSFQMFSKHMLANVGAPILLAQSLYEHVTQRQTMGVVLNLLDQKLWNVNPDFLSYTLSKSALHMSTAMLAQRMAPTVRVCAIAPGLTFPSYLQNEDDFARTARYSLTGDISQPQDIAKAAVFMINTPSISGATLLVDAGQHLAPMGRDVSFL